MGKHVSEALCALFAAWSLSLACATVPPPAPPPVTEISLGVNGADAAEQPTPAREVPPRPVRDFDLPRDWRDVEDDALDALLETARTDGAVLRFYDDALADLGRALGASDGTSARAAVILGNTFDPRAFEVLVSRLEARVPEGARDLSGDVVSAAACLSTAPDRESFARLEVLAVGGRPHPALLVRVECALASLSTGRDACVPFLLDLLREGTGSAVKNPSWRRLDCTDERTLRLQDRIARALSDAAQSECTYRARGALAAREKEIARLARLLQTPSGPRTP